MALHVIIPARYGSSRFPGKPLVSIAGKPMIQHVMERASQAKGVKTVAVATDDERVAQAVEAFGGTVLMTPSACRSGSDRVALAAEALGLGGGELVVNVQGDQPLLPPAVLDECAAPLLAEPELGMSTPVVAIKDAGEIPDPNHVKTAMDAQGNALYFSRLPIPFPRDGEQTTYYKHLGVYIFRRDFLATFAALPTGRLEDIEKLEQLRALEHGFKVRCVITGYDSPEVDRPEDALRVEGILLRPGEGV
ncbi:MAG: 3-deoxy-manno-octulosonate cytidylyltransferase [Desulfarculaceae bacterium]|nr:3-deoxy-manno-octulosonate cytidylyltransferase [Desulfarculaceae bacterium]MCF8046855.1 3-deoxy-manno-octulosonate cytidylyltransferase [Desulfarculaceae bacterium]MCF8098343.1 3-deoxy-manno-octulosonate cytidylyltransferase [Desulfarculaceae bacterium]MCF8121378.1 3-deoxy-manno-octulosonate cytidylyltransferase [Desulfarculaceae bacterium]